ncbi:DsbC family protein [uncultured Sphingomonas sp.]|jgi:thiol:disulfide interchange protein DsbC|uniref:DsbC family protein n=1 Tax=uncultured Sphingomonas sp. TaxID=158754 RepID=UPI0025D2396C|nr:DsbC family protein [uncultured Sphingomonas sp.]
MMLTGSATAPTATQVEAALKERLPKTKVTSVDCSKVDGLCEVVAGQNLFYVDRSARFLVIGRVYDMQTRQDLTAARLLALNPDMLVGSAAKANAAAEADRPEPADRSPGIRVTQPAVAQRLDLSRLSNKGAIVWGSGPEKVTVFSDFHCGYCRALSQTLETMNVTVVERPISVLGSREIADQVLCARDRHAAVRAAYAQDPIRPGPKCDTSGLDENEAFARAHGLNGTPVIVRSDGAVLEGFKPKPLLAQWLKGAKS